MSSLSFAPILRVARPTASLSQALHFYQTALGLDVIGSFDDHSGYDGRILALRTDAPGPAPWHLELTYEHPHNSHADSSQDQQSSSNSSGTAQAESFRAPTRDNLLVLYLQDKHEVEKRKARMEEHGYAAVEPANPYWATNGFTFEDYEGWRVVLCWQSWPN